MRKLASTVMALQLIAGPALAQDLGPAAAAARGDQSLDQAANDPTASLMSLQVQNVYGAPAARGSRRPTELADRQ